MSSVHITKVQLNLLKVHINPFSTNAPLLYSLKTVKHIQTIRRVLTSNFRMFSGGIEMKHWLKMD